VVRDQAAVLTRPADEEATLSPWLRWTGNAPAGANPKAMTLSELADVCDDPARDLPGGQDVRAILTLDPDEGFFLSALDGPLIYLIVDDRGRRKKFRTVELALAVLQDLSGLNPDIGLLQAQRTPA
jgi:hypothetical protein